ncbi:MAG: GSCFA domain-containing protein [Candidatus Cryptobacteroides sp.]
MLKLQTLVDVGQSNVRISLNDKIMLLGSCFSDNIGEKMSQLGFNVCVNPFGPLYNPVSLSNSIGRIASGFPFREEECVRMGAGSELICSFSHHTAAAREDCDTFLADANAGLAAAHEFFVEADTLILTLGTAWTFRWNESGEIVSNCLKRPAVEFTRERLSLANTVAVLKSVVSRFYSGKAPGVKPKKFILTVSPIRHFKDGAHGNQLSKSILLMAAEAVCEAFPEACVYFPSYEIMMDELRDYRFYAEDMLHPSSQAVDYIWERFCDFALPENERPALEENRKAFLRSRHRPLLHSGGSADSIAPGVPQQH